MTKLERYRKLHADTVGAMKAILARADEADGRLNAEAQREYDALDEKREGQAAAIRREQTIEAAELAAPAVATLGGDGLPLEAGARARRRMPGGRSYAEMFGAP